jgi:imidazolonepropionase-like amidohydrolase
MIKYNLLQKHTWLMIGLFIVSLALAACGASEPTIAQGLPTAVPLSPADTPVPTDTAVPLIEVKAQLVVRNGTVIDGTGAEPIPNGLVAIKDGRITAVGPESEFAIPDGVQVLDAQGGTIMPGLIDAHNHTLDKFFVRDGELTPDVNLAELTTSLQEGLTAFRDTGSPFGVSRDISELRPALEALGNSIPTVSFTGPVLSVPNNPFMVCCAHRSLNLANVEEAREATDRLLSEGVDGIKIIVQDVDGFGDPAPSLSPEQIRAITQVAHEHDSWVSAHAIYPLQAEIAIDNGVDQLVHWPTYGQALSDELIEQLVTNDIPVASTYKMLDPLVRPDDVRRFLDAGGTLALGTDDQSGISILPWDEMDQMLKLGMTPMEVIVAATANAAMVSGLGDELGALEVGKQADIIVAKGNPLQNMTVLQDLIVVIKTGEAIIQP